ncbi:MAG: response regulator [Alphaproteobacteria bacterium]|nr:response regulator [Alphaproteobacteria bacterium]
MKHCLVVDDSRLTRTVARRIMEELRYSVEEAEDGMTAVRRARKDALPDFPGLELAHHEGRGIRQERARPAEGGHPVILFCTTEANSTEIASAIAAGANEYVMKPFDGVGVRAKLADIGITN